MQARRLSLLAKPAPPFTTSAPNSHYKNVRTVEVKQLKAADRLCFITITSNPTEITVTFSTLPLNCAGLSLTTGPRNIQVTATVIIVSGELVQLHFYSPWHTWNHFSATIIWPFPRLNTGSRVCKANFLQVRINKVSPQLAPTLANKPQPLQLVNVS